MKAEKEAEEHRQQEESKEVIEIVFADLYYVSKSTTVIKEIYARQKKIETIRTESEDRISIVPKNLKGIQQAIRMHEKFVYCKSQTCSN